MEYGKFEKARIIGARALQIKMGAPVLVTVKTDIPALEVAKLEFEKDAIPISIRKSNQI